jgi:hypothetical protein
MMPAVRGLLRMSRMTTEDRAEGSPAAAATASEDTAAELARLRAERDAAVDQSNRLRRRASRRGALRRGFAVALVVVFAVLLPLAVTATWAHRTVLNTDAFVSAVAPIAAEPAVTEALSRDVTNQLYAALDPQAIIADALPPKAAFLAGPIANGARDYVQNAVQKVISSDQFRTLWLEAVRFSHAQLVTVLRGDSQVLLSNDGQVVLNLVPLLNEALKSLQGFVSGVIGKPVTLPTISGTELPAVACAKIAAVLDRPVPATCGQVALFRADKLDAAQQAVRTFDRSVVALLIITPLIAIAALWLSPRRRRTLLQLTVGAMLGLVVVRRAVIWLQNDLISTGRPENQAARTEIVHHLMDGFFAVSEWFLIGGLIIVVIALATGPYRWARSMRGWLRRAAVTTGALVSAGVSRTAGAAGRTAAADTPAMAWVRAHLDLLSIAGAVLAVLLLLVFDINLVGLLIIAAVLALYEFWLYRLRSGGNGSPAPPAAPAAEGTG